MSRTSPLRRALNAALVAVLMLVGTLAADRAAAHAAMAAAQAMQPPCHRIHHDALAPAPVDACDTVCAGAAPETTYDAVPVRFEAPLPAVTVQASVIVPVARGVAFPAVHYGHGPPPLPAYLRDRRLLI